MGTVTALLPQRINNMKFLLVVTLVAYTIAEAEPEADADPAHLYGTPLIYGAVGAVPHLPTVSVKTFTPAEVETVVNPVTYAYGLGYQGLGYHGLGYGGLGYAGLGGHLGYPYGLVPAVAAAAAEEDPAVEAADRKKREAEAEADPKADPWLAYSGLGYSGLGYSGLGYSGLGYAGLGLGGHLGYPYGLVPAVAAAAAEEPAVEAADRKKRDAEAEADPKADPWLAYS